MVRVSFADDSGNEETLTSEATEAVAAPAQTDAEPPELLSASIHAAPEAHDGETSFTFELRFSEEFELSYKTLKFHAFTVSGGEVKKAQRMNRDSDTPNIRWLITVEPGGNGDVTITLPVTTDCTGDGAICTEDGRMLSNSLVFTVSGPGPIEGNKKRRHTSTGTASVPTGNGNARALRQPGNRDARAGTEESLRLCTGRTGSAMPRQRIHHSRVTYQVPHDFPERLERFKEESGLSWAEIIRRLDIHHETMRRWRKGRARPSMRNMMALVAVARPLGLDHLFTD